MDFTVSGMTTAVISLENANAFSHILVTGRPSISDGNSMLPLKSSAPTINASSLVS